MISTQTLFLNIHNICKCKLDGITAHDSIEISLLQSYITKHNYDIVCLSETFLNSSIQTNDKGIVIDGYILIRVDHSRESKRGGIFVYYKEHDEFDGFCT